MERAVAIKKLAKILGKSLGYQVDPEAPNAEERQRVQDEGPALSRAKIEAQEAMRTRQQVLLDGDQEYQELHAAWVEAKDKLAKAFSLSHRHKITVGTTNGMFFHVKAQGDSWEEVIAKLTKTEG